MNKKLKQFSLILVIATVIFSLAACGKNALKEPDVYQTIGLKPVSEIVRGVQSLEKSENGDTQSLTYTFNTEDEVSAAIKSYHDYLVTEKMKDLTEDDKNYCFENDVCRIILSQEVFKHPEPNLFLVIKSPK